MRIDNEVIAQESKELVRNFTKRPDPMLWTPNTPLDLIGSPKDAVNVFDFEPVAFTRVPPAHFGYMASGIDDEITLRANRSAFIKKVRDNTKMKIILKGILTEEDAALCLKYGVGGINVSNHGGR